MKHFENGNYPSGWGNKPVIWVAFEDAEAYCMHYGKRLPNEWEWQVAAQGRDGRKYPWGNSGWHAPATEDGLSMRGPDDVNWHEDGASPYGVMDMVGNVW